MLLKRKDPDLKGKDLRKPIRFVNPEGQGAKPTFSLTANHNISKVQMKSDFLTVLRSDPAVDPTLSGITGLLNAPP